MSWQVNSKFSALIILVNNGIIVDDLIKSNKNIAQELIDSISERSSASSVNFCEIKQFPTINFSHFEGW